jgi:hypothetical protein
MSEHVKRWHANAVVYGILWDEPLQEIVAKTLDGPGTCRHYCAARTGK